MSKSWQPEVPVDHRHQGAADVALGQVSTPDTVFMSKSWRVKIQIQPKSSQLRVVLLAHKTAPDGLFALLAKFRLEVS
jgi:hypothetical protein